VEVLLGPDDKLLKLSVIIVNMNTRQLVCQCLESIRANAPKCEFEIIVVDNASTDGSGEAIEAQFPEVRLIRNPRNVGFAEANNQGSEIARGNYLLLLNSDTIVLPASLDDLVSAMERDESLGVVAPKLIYPNSSVQMSYGPIPNLFVVFCTFFDVKRLVPMPLRSRISRSSVAGIAGTAGSVYLSWFSGGNPQTRLIDPETYVTGACMLIRRKCYEQVGGLDPGFFMYVDDADYSKRVHDAGWKILYSADTTVVHLQGGTAGKRYRWNSARAYQSMLYFMKKHRGSWAFRVAKTFAVVALFGRWSVNLLTGASKREQYWTLLTDVASYRAPI
jgi:GT2 family glycosyltransferase